MRNHRLLPDGELPWWVFYSSLIWGFTEWCKDWLKDTEVWMLFDCYWIVLTPLCLLCHLIWSFLLFLPDISNHITHFCKGQGCGGGCRTWDCFQPFADPVAYHSISLFCSGASLPFFSIFPLHLFRYIQRWEFRKKYKSTDLAGGEFVIILFNGIDFLFVFIAEEKRRTVNKRIMLLSLWHTVMNSTIHFEWKTLESSSTKLPFPGS